MTSSARYCYSGFSFNIYSNFNNIRLPDPKKSGQKTLEITLWNNAGVKSDFMGRTSMKLDQMLPPATAKEGWFELYEGDRGKHEHVEHSLYVYSILHTCCLPFPVISTSGL